MKKGLKVAVAGAGSGHTPGIVLSLLNHDELDIDEIRLYDIEKERNDDMNIIINFLIKKDNYKISIMSTEDPKEAFEDVDFVFSQIRVGGMKMREMDEKIPLKYGLIGQETCGLGGFSYALRSMNGFLDLVEKIHTYAPDCWILNYTNPETIIAESVRRKYPNLKIINACDMTIGIEDMICKSFDYDRKNWIPVYYGLNHFGFYNSIYDKKLNRDVMPEIIEKIKSEGLYVDDEEESWAKTWTRYKNLLEYFPSNLPNNYLEYYLFSEQIVEQSNKDYTRANEIMDGRLKKIKQTVRKIENNKDLNTIDYESSSHGNYIVDICASIINNKNERFMIIVPNKGAIRNFRDDVVVEIPCYINKNGAEPISLRFDIPDFHKGLMEAQVASEKLLVDAFFENSYQKALEAFTLNQTVPNAKLAKEVLDEFIVVNKGYWPELS
ncbi:6-phospho-alpha-glucosidase [Anaerococcus sp. WCA-380-WT-2B]|uniref:6-phospho-alpha-glucosidase n=1 Tax=Anaerococcus porci TaxID=2652269 RepID=A0A6N7VG53_9FIRM|nr:6-phospho-alpha-glucosidase [Anaerococcus porci]MSS77861.1 6-phospho-alpha-glucosidase [Anaerococcus porci]